MFGTSAEVYADAGAIRYFVDERQEFLESRRVGFLERIGACRDEEIGVLEGVVGVVGVLERQGDGAVDGFAMFRCSYEGDGCHSNVRCTIYDVRLMYDVV